MPFDSNLSPLPPNLYSLRHRVISMPSPGMTAQDAPNGKPQSFEGAMFLYRLHSILRTRRGVTTGGGGEWRDKLLVKAYGEDEQAGEHILIQRERWTILDRVALQHDEGG